MLLKGPLTKFSNAVDTNLDSYLPNKENFNQASKSQSISKKAKFRQGEAQKQGRFHRVKRFYVLKDTVLYYYKSQKDYIKDPYAPKGFYNLLDHEFVLETVGKTKCIAIKKENSKNPAKKLYFTASDVQDWHSGIMHNKAISFSIYSSMVKKSPSTLRYSDSNRPKEFLKAEYSIQSVLKEHENAMQEEMQLQETVTNDPEPETRRLLASVKEFNSPNLGQGAQLRKLTVLNNSKSPYRDDQKSHQSDLNDSDQVLLTDTDVALNGISPERLFASPPKILTTTSSRHDVDAIPTLPSDNKTATSGYRQIFGDEKPRKRLIFNEDYMSLDQSKLRTEEDMELLQEKQDNFSILESNNLITPRLSSSSKNSLYGLELLNSAIYPDIEIRSAVSYDFLPKRSTYNRRIFDSQNNPATRSIVQEVSSSLASPPKGLYYKKKYFEEGKSAVINPHLSITQTKSEELIYNASNFVVSTPRTSVCIDELISLLQINSSIFMNKYHQEEELVKLIKSEQYLTPTLQGINDMIELVLKVQFEFDCFKRVVQGIEECFSRYLIFLEKQTKKMIKIWKNRDKQPKTFPPDFYFETCNLYYTELMSFKPVYLRNLIRILSSSAYNSELKANMRFTEKFQIYFSKEIKEEHLSASWIENNFISYIINKKFANTHVLKAILAFIIDVAGRKN